MVLLLALPVELQRLILKELNTTDLRELCLVSKGLSSVATPILYSTIRLKPHPTHGIELHQKRSLFNEERPNAHLKHVRNLQVIHPRAGKGVASTSIQYIESQVKPKLKKNQLFSLCLIASLESTPDVMPFLRHNEQLRALHLDVPSYVSDTECFAYLGFRCHALRTLSLRLLKDWGLEGDTMALNKLLSQLKNLHSLDLKFWECKYRPVARPPLWDHGLKLIDTIFGMESLRELCLLGNDIPLGYWAEANPGKRVGKGLTLFKSEAVDRGDMDGETCDRDDKFWFENFDPTTLRCFHFCLGIIYMINDGTPEQTFRYVIRNNKIQRMIADCENLEEFRVCNIPQMTNFEPSSHCFDRAKDTLRRLRICSNDWYGMEFLDPFFTKDVYRERQRGIIAELKALQILELTVEWLEWDISSQSLQLVHILREPKQNPNGSEQDGGADVDSIERILKLQSRDTFLQTQAQRFAELTQEALLPSLKIVMFSKLSFYRVHCHTMRFEGRQVDHEEYPPLAFLVERESEEGNDLPYGVAEPISFKEMEYQFPWLYDGSWEGKIWDESRGYRFW